MADDRKEEKTAEQLVKEFNEVLEKFIVEYKIWQCSGGSKEELFKILPQFKKV